MVEVNCETDFVAREHDFRGFADARRRVRAAQPAGRPGGLACAKLAFRARRVEERRRALVAKIGENISVRRVALADGSSDRLGAYVHGTRIGVLVALKGGDDELAHDLAMHVAASNPQYVSPADVPADGDREGARDPAEQAAAEGGQASGDRRQDGRGTAAQVPERDHAAGQPFVKDPGRDRREAAQAGAKRRGARASCASRSAPASRRSRTTSPPRSWRRSRAPARRSRH